MKKAILSLCILAMPLLMSAQSPQTNGNQIQLHLPWIDPTKPEEPNQKSPIVVPVLYIDGYTLTAGDNTLGTTIQILDEDDEVVFSTYVAIEGDIQLPSTLSGTYTIQVISGDLTFIGEIEL